MVEKSESVGKEQLELRHLSCGCARAPHVPRMYTLLGDTLYRTLYARTSSDDVGDQKDSIKVGFLLRMR